MHKVFPVFMFSYETCLVDRHNFMNEIFICNASFISNCLVLPMFISFMLFLYPLSTLKYPCSNKDMFLYSIFILSQIFAFICLMCVYISCLRAIFGTCIPNWYKIGFYVPCVVKCNRRIQYKSISTYKFRT